MGLDAMFHVLCANGIGDQQSCKTQYAHSPVDVPYEEHTAPVGWFGSALLRQSDLIADVDMQMLKIE